MASAWPLHLVFQYGPPIEGLICQRWRRGKGRRALTQEVIRGSEQAAWLVLQAVNRGHAKGSTVRLVAPRDPDIVEELGGELGSGPTDEELLSAEDYLLEHGYIALTGLGVTRNVYTVTLAGLDWLEAGLTAPRGKSQQEPSEEALRRERPGLVLLWLQGRYRSMPRRSGASLSFGGSGTDFCKNLRNSACWSSVWRRSWGGDARPGTRGGSVDARGALASQAVRMI
jgi:hypothetical protein